MAALWALLYAATDRSAEDVLAALDRACLEQVDGQIALPVGREGRSGMVSLDEHGVVRRPDRLLRLLTRNVPLGMAGLQFRDEATGEESCIFVMEVDRTSPRRLEVDMRTIEDLLWPGRAVTLRVRIRDCEEARYAPLTPWSEPFLRLGSAPG